MSLRRLCVRLAPDFLNQTRCGPLKTATNYLSRNSLSTVDGESDDWNSHTRTPSPELCVGTSMHRKLFVTSPFSASSCGVFVDPVGCMVRRSAHVGFRFPSLLLISLVDCLTQRFATYLRFCAVSNTVDTKAHSGKRAHKVKDSPSHTSGGSVDGGNLGRQRDDSGGSSTSGDSTGFDGLSIKLERISQSRIYYPGQSYETDDLAPRERFETEKAYSVTQRTRRAPVRGKAIDKQLLETLDFRNARLLSQFVSETGKILPKRKTGLSAKVHRKMAKQVKVSRVMGIMPFTERLPQLGRRRN